jgi:hypothetical protein
MLDAVSANRISFAVGMGCCRNEHLANVYLRAAGVAAIWIEIDGSIGVQEIADVACARGGRLVYCCHRDDHVALARLLRRSRPPPSQLAIAEVLEQLAETLGVGITPHETAIARARSVVAMVNDKVKLMGSNGGLREFNRRFKAARKADRGMRYFDLLYAEKAAMLEAIAREAR